MVAVAEDLPAAVENREVEVEILNPGAAEAAAEDKDLLVQIQVQPMAVEREDLNLLKLATKSLQEKVAAGKRTLKVQ